MQKLLQEITSADMHSI